MVLHSIHLRELLRAGDRYGQILHPPLLCAHLHRAYRQDADTGLVPESTVCDGCHHILVVDDMPIYRNL